VPITIDEPAIAARAAIRAQQEWDRIDLWVTLAGVDRHRAVTEMQTAVARLPGDAADWRVLPTTPGTYAWMRKQKGWRARVSALASELERLGHGGSIDAAPVEPWPNTMADHAHPTVLMTHRLDPPLSAGPVNVAGRPQTRWGLAPATSQRLLSVASDWIHKHGESPAVGSVAMVPVTPEDGPDVVTLMLEEDPVRQLWVSHRADDKGPRRMVSFEPFGQSAWTDLDDTCDPIDLAIRAARLATHFASDLDLAEVHPTFAGATDMHGRNSGFWALNRHLAASFVPDAFGIQLLTDHHLDRALDLTDWTVEEVAPDRYLVRARDLAAWFAVSDSEEVRFERFPAPALLDQARADFGPMILTREAAAAHPWTPDTP
jgi:hypothetical protein